MTGDAELEPCPCCGGYPMIIPCRTPEGNWYEIECQTCSLAVGYDAEHDTAVSPEEAALQWHRRSNKAGIVEFTPEGRIPLRLCPFCGGEASYVDFEYPDDDGDMGAFIGVECLECPAGNGRAGAMNAMHESVEAAAAAWNIRVEPH